MSDDLDKPDLSLVSTDDLIDEMMKRHDALLIVREMSKEGGTHDTYVDYDGGLTTAIGLAYRAMRRLTKLAEAVDIEDDD